MAKITKTEFVNVGYGKEVRVSELPEHTQKAIQDSDEFFTQMDAFSEAGDHEGLTNFLETSPFNQIDKTNQ